MKCCPLQLFTLDVTDDMMMTWITISKKRRRSVEEGHLMMRGSPLEVLSLKIRMS